MKNLRIVLCLLLLFWLIADVSGQEQNPRFVWFMEVLEGGAVFAPGFSLEGHQAFATIGARFISGAPFPVPLRFGLRWMFQGLDVWPEYLHYESISYFLRNDYEQGFKLGLGWAPPGMLDLSLSNVFFVGNMQLPDIDENTAIYISPTFRAALSDRFSEHSVHTVLSGGFLFFPDSEDSAFGFDIRFPINLFYGAFRITPIIDFAATSTGSLIQKSKALGYSFALYSSFDRSLFSLDGLAQGDHGNEPGAVAFAGNIEGRLYPFETNNPPLNGLFLKLFSDLAYISPSFLGDGRFFYTIGAGVGLEWGGFALVINAGYEGTKGIRFSLSLEL